MKRHRESWLGHGTLRVPIEELAGHGEVPLCSLCRGCSREVAELERKSEFTELDNNACVREIERDDG